ncbi:RING-type domain-containing protein [Fusarium sp. LHS14.1]|nr:RING-type domain-containing protein [Fusarium sp. LHS14.1]
MDHESLMLAIKLQFEDLDLCESSKKGKEREGEVLDADVALGACRHELEQMAEFASDHALCLSIAKAVDLDATLIAELQAEEEQAARDREFARRLSRDPRATPPATTTTEKQVKDVKDAISEKSKSMVARIVPEQSEDGQNQAESSHWGASRTHLDSEECIACTERFATSSLTRSPCSHHYCRECIINLVTSSLHEESLFPPRCCGINIPIETGLLLSPALLGQFQAKKLEFDTPNRTYCSDSSCSTFVPPAFIKGGVAHCPKCSQTTCVHCKEPSHEGVCSSDSASQQVLELAKQNGWQQCKACKRVVELNTGCYHITCLCRAQFCYVCGESWKTCKCPQWHEHRLLSRANAIVDRDNNPDAITERDRALLVERERRNLIENHECAHVFWEWRRGRHRCEECHDMLPTFIFECRQCHIMVCRRCRLNRL